MSDAKRLGLRISREVHECCGEAVLSSLYARAVETIREQVEDVFKHADCPHVQVLVRIEAYQQQNIYELSDVVDV